MKTIVFDLEMNKPTDKIIQIGANLVDIKRGVILDSFDTFVDPLEPIDPFIKDLTGIMDSDVQGAPQIVEALNRFFSWAKDNDCAHFTVWGSDYWVVKNEVEAQHLLGKEINIPKKTSQLNLKETALLFRSCFSSAKSRGGLKATIDLFGLSFTGRQHDARDDAYNTTKLLLHFKKLVQGALKFQEILLQEEK